MLNYIIKSRLVRLYDVLAIVLLSATVNIGIWVCTTTPALPIWSYGTAVFSCILILAGGWCFFWLGQEVLKAIGGAANVEDAAVIQINRRGKSGAFCWHFLFAVIGSVGGFVVLVIG